MEDFRLDGAKGETVSQTIIRIVSTAPFRTAISLEIRFTHLRVGTALGGHLCEVDSKLFMRIAEPVFSAG